MPHPPHTEVAAPVLRRELALAGQLVSGPLASFVAQLAVYYRTGEKCTGASRLALAAVLIAAALCAGAAALAAHRTLRRVAATALDLPPRTSGRARFMATSALAMNALALLFVLAMTIPVLVLRPCE